MRHYNTAVAKTVLWISSCVLIFYFTALQAVPELAFSFRPDNGGWHILYSAWPAMQRGDIITEFNGLSFEDAAGRSPLDNLDLGEEIELRMADGRILKYQIPSISWMQAGKVIYWVMVLPFWLGAFLILHSLNNEQRLRSVMAVVFAIFAAWLGAGHVSGTGQAGSGFVMRVLSWMLLPIMAHLHTEIAFPAWDPKRLLTPLYAISAVAIVAEIFGIMPHSLYLLAVILAFGASIIILGISNLRTKKRNTSLLIWSLVFSVTPAMVWLWANAIHVDNVIYTVVAAVSLNMWPMVYTFVMFRRHLGQAEGSIRQFVMATSCIIIGVNVLLVMLTVMGYIEILPLNKVAEETIALFLVGVFSVVGNKRLSIWMTNQLNGDLNQRITESIAYVSASLLTIDGWEDLRAVIVKVCDLLQLEQYCCTVKIGGITKLHIKEAPFENEWVLADLQFVVRDRKIGNWELGSRVDGDYYTTQQKDGLQRLSVILSAAIEIVNQRDMLKLQQETLIKQEKMASLARMAASITHQINNPLQIITGGLETFNEYKPFNDKSPYPLRLAYDNALYLRDVVRSIARFVQPTSKDLVEIDVHESIQSALMLINGRIKQQRLTVHLHLSHEVQMAKMYPSDLTQVISVLLENACDAMPNGGMLVINTYILYAGDASDTSSIVIEVEDTGSGIPEEIIDRVFEPCFTTKAGSGMGLTTAYFLVERCGGSISVKSDFNKGSDFRIKLPLLS